MRMLVVLLVAALVCSSGCMTAKDAVRENASSSAASGEPEPVDGSASERLLVLFAATESDVWSQGIFHSIGNLLDIAPEELPGVDGHLDTYGPYSAELDDKPLEVRFAFCGFSGVVGLEAQGALAQQAASWVAAWEPDVVWLDGDLLQFQLGSLLPVELPVVFTGVMLDRDIYYGPDKPNTGVYRRYDLSRVLKEIWLRAPEASTYGLIADDSPAGGYQLNQFALREAVLPTGHRFAEIAPFTEWRQLRSRLEEHRAECDAFIVCGAAQPGSSLEGSAENCDADLLAGLEQPVIVLGSSPLDKTGAVVISLRPGDHAAAALKQVRHILGGINPRALLVETPADAEVFVSSGG